MDIEKTIKNLKARGFEVSYFKTGDEASGYLNEKIDGEKVAFGGSMTVQELGLYESLGEHNDVFWHWKTVDPNQKIIEAERTVYVTSANAVSEDGEIVNIDGAGNRVAHSVYGKKKVYFVCGINKIAKDFDAAVKRARQVAAPKNAQRMNRNTPCVKTGKCADCKSDERICNILTVLLGKPMRMESVEVVLIGEDIGY